MAATVMELYGSKVFNEHEMRERLPSSTYKSLKATIEKGQPLDLEVANVVASVMKRWAIEQGATHYTHWFQPLTGITSEKVCSGKFERGMEAYHVQEGKNIKLATGTQLMAQDRAIVDEAYAGDIIGLFDPGIFSIGDTLCTGKKKVQFAGIPTFSPEHFARIEQKDTMKRKQFVKGMEQIAQEGAIQIFREVGGGMEEVVVGVVGVLQLEVLEYRLNTEYNVEIRMQQLPFEQLRWVQNDPDTYNLRDLDLTSDTKAVEDMKGNRLLLFTSDWAVRWAETHNESLQLSEFGNI